MHQVRVKIIMNPQGGVDTVQGGCGCPNIVAGGVMFPLGSIQGSCASVDGYTSVYDPLTNIAPATEVTNPTVATATGASCTQLNDSLPQSIQYGPYPIQAGMGEPMPLDSLMVPFDCETNDPQFGVYPFVENSPAGVSTTIPSLGAYVAATTSGTGASVLEDLTKTLASATETAKGALGLSSDAEKWVADMRARWNTARGPLAPGQEQADEASFQNWLEEVKKRFRAYQAEQPKPMTTVVVGAQAGDMSGTSKKVIFWILLLAIVGLAIYKRDDIKSWFTKKTTASAPAATGANDLKRESFGSLVQRYRRNRPRRF